SSSDLLIDNCDEFIYYDDLVRKKKSKARGKTATKGKARKRKAQTKKPAAGAKGDSTATKDGGGDRDEAFDLVLDTVDALFQEREDNLWGSMVKQTLKRKRPMFSEAYYGFPSFNELLEEMQTAGLLDLQKDERSGGYVILAFGPEA
ncbi:MAG: NYN domain-containing protein, partial [Myxococcota bacterium]